MTPAEFTTALQKLAWKQTDFARKAGMGTSSITRWATGETPIPEWAAHYLGAMIDLQRLYDSYIRVK